MGYNRNCFEHNLKWKKEQRELKKIQWKTDSIYVDVETGEIVNKNLLKKGEYIKIKSTTNIKTDRNGNKSKTITNECRRGQESIF
jgi:3-isopropylmalate dehydratase small subunit